jgi:hypothetical protein
MPVTARLSRKFYETFGDEIATELVDWFNSVDSTCRSELRELVDLYYARFENTLNQFRAEVRADMAALRAELIRWMFVFWLAGVTTLFLSRAL